MADEEEDAPVEEEEEEEEEPVPEPEEEPKPHHTVPDAKPSIALRILPEFKNLCESSEEIHETKAIDLTDERARDYAGAASLVGWKGRVDYALDYLEPDTHLDNKLLAQLLEGVVSTVIVMASGGEPDDDHLIAAVLFLRYVRNEFGKYPHNIGALLEFMKTKFSPPILEELEAIGDPERDELPPNVYITQIPSVIQAKICKNK